VEESIATQPAVKKAAARAIAPRSSRAKLRDSILQVSATSDEDPFEEVTAQPERASEDLPPATTTQEPATPADEPPAREMPRRSVADPFPEEPLPTPPEREAPEPELQERDEAPGLTPSENPPGDLGEGISTPPGDAGCKDYGADCARAIRDLQSRDITKIVVGLVIEGVEGEDYPCDCRLGVNVDAPPFVPRNFARTCFTWKSSSLCHKPLYFEDVQLERYGHSWNPVLQPFMSAGHFFVSVPLLPYKMGLNPPNECIYSLGYYRPGSCAPYMLEPIPLSLRAAIYQGLGSTAFAFWFWPG
jgi:hypothetical protein